MTDRKPPSQPLDGVAEHVQSLSEPSNTLPQFTVRCADGHVMGDTDPDEVWMTVEGADRSAELWNGDCLTCDGPHDVLVRTVTTTAWEALDA